MKTATIMLGLLLAGLMAKLAADSVFILTPGGQILATSNPVLSSVTTNGTQPSALGLTAGVAPTSTVINSKTYDIVLYVDMADGKLKARSKAGAVVVLGP